VCFVCVLVRYMVMEYCGGGTLTAYCQDTQRFRAAEMVRRGVFTEHVHMHAAT